MGISYKIKVVTIATNTLGRSQGLEQQFTIVRTRLMENKLLPAHMMRDAQV